MRFIYCGKIKDVYEDGFYFVFYFKDLVFGEDGREDIGVLFLMRLSFFFVFLKRRE